MLPSTSKKKRFLSKLLGHSNLKMALVQVQFLSIKQPLDRLFSFLWVLKQAPLPSTKALCFTKEWVPFFQTTQCLLKLSRIKVVKLCEFSNLYIKEVTRFTILPFLKKKKIRISVNLAGNDLVFLDYWMPSEKSHGKCLGKFHHLHESKIRAL